MSYTKFLLEDQWNAIKDALPGKPGDPWGVLAVPTSQCHSPPCGENLSSDGACEVVRF
jgi:hypothetical protein